MRVNRRGFLSTGVAGVAAVSSKAADAAIVESTHRTLSPRVEFLNNPLGLETPRPRFSWRIEASGRNIVQGAYRILVADRRENLAPGKAIWDSGRVPGAACTEIPYAGPELESRQRCYWQVETWCGGASNKSEAGWFEMGLLSATDWRAGWLAAEDDLMRADREAGFDWIWASERPNAQGGRGFRYEFDLRQRPAEAVLFLAGKSKIDALWVNGISVDLPDGPIATNLMSRIELRGLKRGRNTLAVRASADNTLIPGAGIGGQLRLKYKNGSIQRLTSSKSWKTAFVRDDSWTASGFKDSDWSEAAAPKIAPQTIPWITPAMYMRRDFVATKKIARARLYATALGAYEAHINGARIGDAHMAPDYTNPSETLMYQVYDVTDVVRPGENTIGLWVGDGWYASHFSIAGRYCFGPAPRRVRAQLELTYEDGATDYVTTDGDGWRVHESPILYSDVYAGEIYDARLEQPGWANENFDASHWNVARSADASEVPLRCQIGPRIRPMQTIPVARRTSPKAGVYVYDFGQNFSGWARLKAQGPAGTRVTMRFAEVLKANGEIDQANLRTARATDAFILAGTGSAESFAPRFTFHGFRYVELSGYPGEPPADALEGICAYSECAVTGNLKVENPVIDNVWRNAVWSQKSNFFGMPTDCPQRDERLGWMGDAQVFWDAAAHNMDVDGFTRKFMADIRAAQTKDGAFPDVIPPFAPIMPQGSPGWADAGVVLPYTLFKHYGDLRVVEENWSAMTRWLDYILKHNPDFIWRKKRGSDYADWLSVDARFSGDATTPKDLVGTAMWAHSTGLMLEMARASGLSADAEKYETLQSNLRRAFAAEFLKADGVVGNGSQTSYVLALRFGLIPKAARAAAARNLAADIKRRGDKLSTGFLGTPYILDALADAGHGNVAWSLLLQTEYPSWGYMVKKGATTMWERWNGDAGDVSMNSYNHYAFGAVAGFMFRRLAGIDAAEAGFKTVRVRPLFDARVERGGGDYDSVRGRISTRWRRLGAGQFTLDVSLPANSSGEIHLPAAGGTIREGSRGLSNRAGISVVASGAKETIVRVGSGDYSFRAV